jgi:hypothetical protein
MFDKLIQDALGNGCFTYMHTQDYPLVIKHHTYFATFIFILQICEPISLASRGFDNLFILKDITIDRLHLWVIIHIYTCNVSPKIKVPCPMGSSVLVDACDS